MKIFKKTNTFRLIASKFVREQLNKTGNILETTPDFSVKQLENLKKNAKSIDQHKTQKIKTIKNKPNQKNYY